MKDEDAVLHTLHGTGIFGGRMRLLIIIFLVTSMGLLVACNSSSHNSDICGGSRAVSLVPAALNNALIKATVLEIRPNGTGTTLRLFITEAHGIPDPDMSAVAANTEIEAGAGQLPDINVNDTITAFVSLFGDECFHGLGVTSVVKVPNVPSGAPDTVTVTVSGQSGTVTTSFTEGPYNAQDTLATDLISFVTSTVITRIQLHSGGTFTQGATSLFIDIAGTIPQSYTLGGVNAVNNIVYNVFDTQHQPGTGYFLSTSGTVTFSSIGAVGEKITGDFDAVLAGGTSTSTPETLKISGTFSVTREN